MRLKRIVITDKKTIPNAAIREIELSMREKLEYCESYENLQTGDIVLLSISHHLGRQLIDRGLTELHNTTPEMDAFHVLCANHVLYIIGSSRRGIMQGIHQLALNDEFRNYNEGIEHKGSSSMPFRAFALLDDGVFKDVSDAETIRSCVRYLSVMGASHVAATNDFSGGPEKMLHSFVPSKIFPNSTPPEFRSRLRGILRTVIDAAGEYGLDVLFDTALLPSCYISQREELINAFSPDVISPTGPVPHPGHDSVLCFSHPKVQEFYREVIANFFTEFPEIDSFHYLTTDADGEFCDPELCPRCRGLSKLDQRDRLSRFLSDVMGKARPGIKIFNTAFDWERSKFGVWQMLLRQAAMPQNVGLCMAGCTDPATYERQSHEAIREARRVTWKSGQLLIGREACHRFENLRVCRDRFISDYPFGVVAKVRRWADLKADGFFDVRGRFFASDFFLNSLVCREALLNPHLDAEKLSGKLAGEFFESAGDEVLEAWKLIERGDRIMSNAFTFPSASYLTQYLGWFWGDHIPPLPEAEKFIAPPEDLNEVTPYAALGYVYHAGNFQEQEHDSGSGMLNSLEYYQKACQKLQEAVLKVRKGESPPVCLVFMGNDYVWDPQRQLKAVKCYYELMCYATECTGSYHVLHSLYHTLKADGNENEYGYRGKHYLKQYADSLEQLDRFCELMYAEKMIVNHKYGTYRNNGEKLACVLAVRNFLAKL